MQHKVFCLLLELVFSQLVITVSISNPYLMITHSEVIFLYHGL